MAPRPRTGQDGSYQILMIRTGFRDGRPGPAGPSLAGPSLAGAGWPGLAGAARPQLRVVQRLELATLVENAKRGAAAYGDHGAC